MSTLTVPQSVIRTRSSSFIKALADVTGQGKHSETFTTPDLKDNIIIPDLVDFHVKFSAQHTTFVTDSGKSLSLKDRGIGVYKCTKYILDNFVNIKQGSVIAFLAETEPIAYSTMILGVMRAGLIPFPISNRNSVPAIKHLIKNSNCNHLIFSSNSKQLKELAITAEKELRDNDHPLTLMEMLTYNEIFNDDDDNNDYTSIINSVPQLSKERRDLNSSALIIHSSGSTSFPKVIVQTNKNLIQWSRIPFYGSSDVCDKTLFVGALPTFHAMGIGFQITMPLATGLRVAFFEPHQPPTFPTAPNVIRALIKTSPNFVMVPSSIIKEWAQSKSDIEQLKKLDAVMYGGSPMAEEIGNYLVDNGVKLSNQYGTTETGHVTSFFTKPNRDWQYLTLSPHTKPRFVPETDMPNVFELQFLNCDSHKPSRSNLEDVYGFATNDLVEIHPDNRNLVKIVGRKDDQIMLSNGEKTNPGPIESIIDSDKHVKRSVMFGRSKPNNGIIVEPFDTQLNRNALIDLIWGTIERANEFSPQHSRLFKNFIILADPNRPFELTPKGSIKRKQTLEKYNEEIENVYKEAENINNDGYNGIVLDLKNVDESVKNTVADVLNVKNLDPSLDLFTQGCDSLQATMIRNKLRRLIKNKEVSTNVVFEYPTLNDLTRHVKSLLCNKDNNNNLNLMATQDLKRTIMKYTNGFSKSNGWNEKSDNSSVYLITGTTGSLGSYLLSSLLKSTDKNKKIGKIYAFNRFNSNISLYERQKLSLISRGLDDSIINDERLVLVEGDSSLPNLGVDDELLQDMKQSVTNVIHNAWKVNFNLNLHSFESDLESLKNLINFSIESNYGSSITFLSSIGTLNNWPKDRYVPEQVIFDEGIAIGLGYGESKYVGERMLYAASKQTGLKTATVRSGQIAGSRSSGSWNTNEWLPSIIKSATTLKCLPTGDDVVAWLPVDYASQSVIDISKSISNSNNNENQVFSLVHPKPAKWSKLMEEFKKELNKDITLVDYKTWLKTLESFENKSNTSINLLNDVPSIKLKTFFDKSFISDSQRPFVEALGNPLLETKRVCKTSESLKNCESLNENDVKIWIKYWKSQNFL